MLLLIPVFLFWTVQASTGIRKANRYFELYDYSKAVPLYLEVIGKENPEHYCEAVTRLADCYRLMNCPGEAAGWYEKAVSQKNTDPLNYFFLGQVLRILGRYDEAESAFLKYAALVPDDERGNQFADYSREIKNRISPQNNIEIQNIGTLNTPFNDFGPVFYKNGILFVSDREKGFTTEDSSYPTGSRFLNLYHSKIVLLNDSLCSFSVPGKMPDVFNQRFHNGPVSFSRDFSSLFLTRTGTKKGIKQNGIRTHLLKLYMADLREGEKIRFTPFPFNSQEYSVGHPALSGNGNTVVFSSDMPGGLGGTDLYISLYRRGKWSVPMNLGKEINSAGNEVFPVWVNDSILIFSSDGLMGFGGLDLYETTFKDGKWSVAYNLPAPVNSSYDDFAPAFLKGSRNFLISSNRPGGSGKDDLYLVKNLIIPVPRKSQAFILQPKREPEVHREPEKEIPPHEPIAIVPPAEITESTPEIKEEPSAYFTVQVRASFTPLDVVNKPPFQGENVVEKKIGTYYKYFIGKFETFQEAQKAYRRLRPKFPDCFITGFLEDEPLPVDMLRKILEE